ncbi:class I tRNA ligase family protein [Bacillus cereus]
MIWRKKGYIYKGQKPVYWSPTSESALAEAEIEYQDKKICIYLRSISCKDGKNVLEGDEKYIIWTTTPWTLPANLGISVHPELEYAIVKVNGEKYIIALNYLRQLQKR